MPNLTPILVAPAKRRDVIRDKTVEGVKSLFPIEGARHILEIQDVKVHPQEFGSHDQKSALMEGRSLMEPVKGVLVLKDKQGNVLQKTNPTTLLHLPYYTDRHTFIVDGNEYSVGNQVRLKPGVYTRRRGNAELESQFNLIKKGGNFSLAMEPETGKLHMKFGGSNIDLYPVLRGIGVSHHDIAEHWGHELAAQNEAKYGKKVETAIQKLYDKMTPEYRRKNATTHEARVEAVRNWFSTAKMDPEVVKKTLGVAHESVQPATLLKASQKLINVFKSAEDIDDRDSLEFKRLHSVDDFVRERIQLSGRDLKKKIVSKLDHGGANPDVKSIVPAGVLTPTVKSFLTQSDIAAIPTNYNPMEVLDVSQKITPLGEGGIGDIRAVPYEARQIHHSHLGIIDPIRTTECFDGDTEVFTAAGWRPWAELPLDTVFACNIEGVLHFLPATHRYEAAYAGPMCAIKNGKVNLFVTPNHRMWVRPYAPPGESAYRFETAGHLLSNGVPRTFAAKVEPYAGNSARTTFVLPEVPDNRTFFTGNDKTIRAPTQAYAPVHININDWAEFFGWFAAEGSCVCNGERGKYNVTISQDSLANAEKYARIDALLARMPFTYGKNAQGFTVSNKQLAAYLSQFGDCYDKYIPEYLLTAPIEARSLLLEALLLGDGCTWSPGNAHRRGYPQAVYTTTSVRLRDDVERLALSLGHSVRVSRYQDTRQPHYAPMWSVRLLRSAERTVSPKRGQMTEIEYNGKVYCATVPGGLLLVRRHGSVPVWVGNSEASGADVRAAIHTARDENGNLYTPLLNVKTGKHEYIPAHVVAQSVIAFPNEDVHGTKYVDAIVRGVIKSVDPKEVQYQVKFPHTLYSPATNLVPFIESQQGNRALMAAKMQTQALCLKEREAPWVQVASYQKGRSMEEEFGRMTTPVSRVDGKVEKIDKDFIYIRPHTKKTAERHAIERLEQRTTLHPSIIEHLDNVAQSLTADGMADSDYYMPLPFNQGTAAFKAVGEGPARKLVLATILGPDMKGKGEKLPKYHYERMFKAAEDAFEKTAADAKGLVKVPYMSDYPLGAKSFLHNELSVKEGDEVKADQRLGDSNYTRDGTMALGKNLRVALMAYRGLNSNDAIVISESAAKKLTSIHLYKEKVDLDGEITTGREKHRTYYGNKYTRVQYDKLDEDGCVKKGERLEPGDIVFATLSKASLSAESQMLGKLHKSLVKPVRDSAHIWEHNFPGVVQDVFKTPKGWAITVKTEEPMVIGDKLSGRHGNKGVVSAILPDDQMVRGQDDKPVDVLYTSAGIISRINPSQVLEMAVGKVAEKTGKPIAVPHFTGKNNVKWAKELLKEHGLTDKEEVFDPGSGKKVKGIMVGPQYMFKLMKTTSTNYSARGVDAYDVNEQPTKGGTEGAKGLGRMEFAGFIAHNARDLLKEQSLIRSQKNDEFWRRLQLGLPPPAPKTTFAYDKFGAMLQASGVKLDKSGNRISLGALTDKHIDEISAGKVEEPLFLRAKDLKPEDQGLFDPVLTGGASGTKWAHVELHEPIVNPIFEDAARRLLGMTGPEFRKTIAEKGAGYIKAQLDKINVETKRADLKTQTKTLRGSNLDSAVKQIKYLDALKKQGLKPGEAYVLSKIPVIPPIMRPVIPGPRGDVLVNDANYLYRDLMLANAKLKTAKEELGTPEAIARSRTHLHDATAALFGLKEPVSPQNSARGVKGFLSMIAGTSSPKYGFFQGKLIKRQLDLSGRSTIAPDTNLAMDEIGIPDEMLWTMFEPFVIGRLVRKGYEATRAKQMVKDRAPAARTELLLEAKERPVIYNRAPSLHRYNLIAAYPKTIPGQTIRLPATWSEPMLNADYDGDTVQIHTPITRGGVEDAKKMTIPNMLFADKSKNKLFVLPQHEAVIGSYKATMGTPTNKPVKKFKNREDALAAYRRGEIGINDPVEVA